MARPRKHISEQHICGERVNLTLAEAAELERAAEITGHAKASLLRAAWKLYQAKLEREHAELRRSIAA